MEDDFLIHFGVKGMKWGQRKAHRQEMRAKDKASVKNDADERSAKIDAARVRVVTGKTDQALKDAKAQYKVDKNTIGRREATKALVAARETHIREVQTAQQWKDGKDFWNEMLRGTDWNGIPYSAAKGIRKANA